MYTCERCGYCSLYKGNLKNHLNRKIICKPLLKDIGIVELKEKINKKEKLIKVGPKMDPNGPKMDPNGPKMDPNGPKMDPKWIINVNIVISIIQIILIVIGFINC